VFRDTQESGGFDEEIDKFLLLFLLNLVSKTGAMVICDFSFKVQTCPIRGVTRNIKKDKRKEGQQEYATKNGPLVDHLFENSYFTSCGVRMSGEQMPRGRGRKTSFGFGEALMAIAAVFFIWLVLKTLKIIDPPEDFTMYILEAILGVMIAAWFTESRDFRKKTMAHGEAIVQLSTKIDYLEKGLDALKANPRGR
jgi:F0F1-type ATP synthase assembly protein I